MYAAERVRIDNEQIQTLRRKSKEDIQREIRDVLAKKRLELETERLELERERLELDKERLDIQREQLKEISPTTPTTPDYEYERRPAWKTFGYTSYHECMQAQRRYIKQTFRGDFPYPLTEENVLDARSAFCK